MKIVLKVFLPLGILGSAFWWLIVAAIPEAIVSKVVLDTVRDGVPGNALVLAERTHELRARIQGIVKKTIMLPNGKPVKVEENATIAILDVRDAERSLEQLNVNRKHHERRVAAGSALAMQLETEQKDLEAWTVLAKQEKIPLADLQKKENLVRRLETQLAQEEISNEEKVESFRIQEAVLRENLKKMEIRTPFTGQMTLSRIAPGDMVPMGALLGRILSNERLIEVTLNEEDFGGTKAGQEVAVTLLSSGPEIFEGEVTRLSPVVEPTSGRRKLYVELDGGNERFPPGSSGRAEVIRSIRENVLTVPRKALMGNALFVIRKGIVEAREVRVGARNLLTTEIISGVKEGEQVIVETPHLFRDGQKVKPMPVGGS